MVIDRTRGPRFPKDLQLVVAKQGERFESRDEPTALVDNAETVGVSVCREAHVGIRLRQLAHKPRKIVRERFGLDHPRKARIPLMTEFDHRGTAAGYERSQVSGP